jgi:hypothetical protein
LLFIKLIDGPVSDFNIGGAKEQAQWCIFDPIISIIYGLKYQQVHEEQYLQLQTHYFNRSLAQLTEENSIFGGL